MLKKYQIAIKFGGALTEQGSLTQIKALGKAIARLYHKKANFVVIPGGGVFAEMIREVQKKYNLNDEEAHWMAILAMDQHSYLLQHFIPNSRVIAIETLLEEQEQVNIKQVPILSVYSFLRDQSQLEHSWEVTSDALATEIACYLNMQRIVFLKAVDGIVMDGMLVRNLSLEAFTDLECSPLDRKTAEMLRKGNLNARILNGFSPERLEKALYEKNFIGTEVLCKKNHKA